MNSRAPRTIARTLALAAVFLAAPRAVHAELVVLTTGGAMSVKSYRVHGDLITVVLRRGGEATFDRALVASITGDEAPPEPGPEPQAEESGPRPVIVPPIDLSGRPYAGLIDQVAARHGVSAAIVHAMVKAESNYESRARSPKGARGLMQVLPSTGRQFGRGNLYDPGHNLDAGVRYLKGLLAEFALPEAIAAYNAGPAAVRRFGGVPPYVETRDYVDRVLSNLAQ
jgi:hypothetical protein